MKVIPASCSCHSFESLHLVLSGPTGGSYFHLLTGSGYNIPVCIWLHETHPVSRPRCYVCPSVSMVINPSCACVEATGIISLDGLRNWTHVRPTEHLRWGPRRFSWVACSLADTTCSTGKQLVRKHWRNTPGACPTIRCLVNRLLSEKSSRTLALAF